MRLEADDGRPEASPPLRGVVQAADRAALRERQAGARDQGRVRHLAFHAAPLGPGHPQQRLHESRRQLNICSFQGHCYCRRRPIALFDDYCGSRPPLLRIKATGC